MKTLKNIGIITWHYYGNFGSALQAFALQKKISELGYDVEFINYRNPKFGKPNNIKNIVRIILSSTLGRFNNRFIFGQSMFSHKYLREGRVAMNSTQLAKIAEKYDTIVCGSDQIWAPNVFNPVYFANFAPKDVRKISYAASIGLNEIPDTYVPKYRELLSDFYAISVREKEAKTLLEERCKIDSTVVIDPTLLHDSNFYVKIQRRVPNIKGKYILCYFLNGNHKYRKRVEEYAHEHRLQIIGISSNKDDKVWMKTLDRLGADHFIWLINHAEAVMTDSYHGAIFSLLFHKNFWTFVRFEENNPICQNSRIRQLQTYFGLKGHVLDSKDSISEDQIIDYSFIDDTLAKLRFSSVDFLKNAL